MSHTLAAAGGVKAKTDAVPVSRLFMLVHGVAFVAGFSVVFVTIGITATALGSIAGSATTVVTDIISRLGGVVIIFFGLHFMGIIPRIFNAIKQRKNILNIVTSGLLIAGLSWLIVWGFVENTIALPVLILFLGWAFYRGALTEPRTFWLHQIERIETALYSDTRGDMQSSRDGLGGSFIMGVVFSAGWTPCIGPLLGAILTMAATTGEIGSSAQLLGAYSLGLGIPFLLTAILLDSVQGLLRRIQRHMHKVELVSGSLLVMIGFLVASGQMTLLSQNLNNQFADFSYRVEECGIGFFGGEIELKHLSTCVEGGLTPIHVDESTRIALTADTPQHQVIFKLDEAQTIQFEVTNLKDLEPVIQLYTNDGELLAESDQLESLTDRAYLSLSYDFTETGLYQVIITSPTAPEGNLRLKIATPTESATEAPVASGDNIDTVDNLADSLAPPAIDTAIIGTDIGEQAPDFTVTSIEGDTITLSELRGQKVLVNFWGTWCGPCRREMPELQELYQDHGDDIEIIALAVNDTPEAVAEFKAEFGLTFPLALDENRDITYSYAVPGQPTTYILDENGQVIWRSFSIVTREQLDEALGYEQADS